MADRRAGFGWSLRSAESVAAAAPGRRAPEGGRPYTDRLAITCS
jgi:hypothetical protein